MKISEAANKWNVKAITICKYIERGWIADLKTTGNEVILPNIPKPMIINSKIKLDDFKMMKLIMKACNEDLYLSSYMLNITGEHFERLIKTLLNENYITGQSQHSFSNVGYYVTVKGMTIDFNKRADTIFNFINNIDVNLVKL